MTPPFSYPPRPWDGALAAAGQAERLVRAALRRLGWKEARRVTPLPSVPLSPPRGRSPAGPPGDGSPILYLPAVAWGYRVQRPQHLALALARAGHSVLYVDGFLRSRLLPSRQVIAARDGVYALRVRVPGRPDPYREVLQRPAAERLAEVLLAGLGTMRPAMVLVQLPFWAELGRELARRLGAPLVYDRIDLHTGFPGVPPEIAAAETALIREADLVCATSALLADLPRSLGARVLLLPNAADLAAFPAPSAGRPARTEVRIGYVGALGPWFDAAAVRTAALALPGWRFRLAGRVEDAGVAALGDLPNVELPGEIPFREVPGFLAGVDAALVPFQDSPLTRAVDPVKLYEALALGLPVVARRLPETERWQEPLVYLYDAPEDFVRQVRRAVEEDSAARAAERRRAAEGESWDRRAAELLASW
jgi:O-antigen biosynthesis protein